MKNNTLIMIILVIVVAAGGFFAGMQYQKSKGSSYTRGAGLFGQRGSGTNRSGGRPVSGDILSSDDKSVTVKLQDGSTKIVLVGASTSINKATTGSKSDLATGIRISAFGTDNGDGTFTATNIQVNPTFGMGSGSPSGTPQPTP
ncbi:MAG TPA: hypothetical protein VMR81_02515 [Patescibacteria group bacterium]|jgi:hypothetical protein|nr:hypothetical protein [Patescibacteria group bacterium]